MNLHALGHALKLKAKVLYKQEAEVNHWKNEILKYIKWYNGEIKLLYNIPSPLESEKIKVSNEKDSAILTVHKTITEAKYLSDLGLRKDIFKGLKLLDIGIGPIPGGTCFEGADLYCLEPLLNKYLEVGFPIHYYGCKFIHALAEEIPVENYFFDAVISTNAIDHVDNLKNVSSEIRRVLKLDGLFRMHVHYHGPSVCEPIELNDVKFMKAFEWVVGLHKICETKTSFLAYLPEGETYALWSNF